MEKAGLFLLGLAAVFYFLVIAAALMTTYPVLAVVLVVAGFAGLLMAQVVVDRLKNRKDDHPQNIKQ
ncbi:MAG: hypothetical protein F9K27_13445 [Anaerolineae bacterium]|nr:MAG: hypothetical protein F9K27_13445 [Anaerolineae bacterium]